MARSANLTNFHVWAQEAVRRGVTDNLVDVPVFLAALSRKGRVSGTFGKLDERVVVGKTLPSITGVSTSGTTLRHIVFRKEQGGGGKVLSADGTRASAGTDRFDKKYQSAYFHWTHFDYAVAIRNEALRQAAGQGKRGEIGDLISRTTIDATSDFIAGTDDWTGVASRIYTGNPSSQSTDEPWDNLVGLDQWIHDSNTLGGVDRSSVNGFSGVRITTAKVFTLDLLDEAMLDYDGSGTGMKDKGAKLDLWIMGNQIYRVAKQQALANGAQLITPANEQLPSGGKLGYIDEYINYNGRLLVADSYCASASVYGLDTRTWEFEVDPAYNFKFSKFVNLSELQPGTGQPDITTANAELRARLLCFDPGKNIHYTAVSAA